MFENPTVSPIALCSSRMKLACCSSLDLTPLDFCPWGRIKSLSLQQKGGYTRRILRWHIGCCCPRKEKWRSTQTYNTRALHTSCKGNWGWRLDFWPYIVNCDKSYIFECNSTNAGHSVDSNPTGGMDVCCECCVLSGRGLCDELITRPEESYRLWRVVVCDLEISCMRRPWPNGGCRAKNKQTDSSLKHQT
jgi:hypothetical protein